MEENATNEYSIMGKRTELIKQIGELNDELKRITDEQQKEINEVYDAIKGLAEEHGLFIGQIIDRNLLVELIEKMLDNPTDRIQIPFNVYNLDDNGTV